MTLALCLILIESKVLPIAAPSLQCELNISPFYLQWIVNAYYLTTAIFMIIFGRIADTLGKRRFFILGILLFAPFSLLGYLATTPLELILSRIGQGLATAMVGSTALTVMWRLFAPRERGKMIGLSAGVGASIIVFAPLVAGYLTYYYSWRWTFLLTLPFVVIAAISAKIGIPHEETVATESLDCRGCILLFLTLLAIGLGMLEVRSKSVSVPFAAALFLSAIPLMYALYWRSRHVANPFFDFSIFRKREFNVANYLVFVVNFVLVNPLFWSLFLQKSMGVTAVEMGAIALFASLPVLFFSPLSGMLTDRFHPELSVRAGFLVIVFCYVTLLLFAWNRSMTMLIIGFVLHGIGTALVMTPMNTITLRSVPKNRKALATGVYNTIKFFGAAAGIALLGYVDTGILLDKLQAASKEIVVDRDHAKDAEMIYFHLSAEKEHLGDFSERDIQVLEKNFAEGQDVAFFMQNGLCLLLSLSAFGASYLLRKEKKFSVAHASP